MPWNVLSDLLNNPTEATLQGLDARERAVMVELQEALPPERQAKLTFPCGGSVSGAPKWQRNDSSGRVMAAFHLPGLCEDTWTELAPTRPDAVRDEPRVPTRLWVTFPLEERSGTVTVDLSLQGCRLDTDFSDKVGQRISLYLDLPDSCAPAYLQAKVVWSNNGNSGLRFLNLTTRDEVRILKALGRISITPSNFLPQLQLNAPCFTYEVTRHRGRTQLQLSITNWLVTFEFEEAEVFGAERGAFQDMEVLESSEKLRALRARLGISLDHQQTVSHLTMLNAEGEVLMELTGKEVGFWREARTEVEDYQAEVP